MLSTHPDGRGIRVGVLSPHPITVEKQLVTLPKAGLPQVPDVDGATLKELGRGALQGHVDVAAGTRLMTAHLKSKLLTYPNVAGSRSARTNGPAALDTPSYAGPPKRWPYGSS